MNNKLDYALYEKFELYATAFVEIKSSTGQASKQKEAMTDKIMNAIGSTADRKQKKAALREKRKKDDKQFIVPF